MIRDCDGCTLCCKLPAIEALNKPAQSLCQHAHNGCKIYPARPVGCRAFNCLWKTNMQVPEKFKPSRVKAFMYASNGKIFVMIDKAFNTPTTLANTPFGEEQEASTTFHLQFYNTHTRTRKHTHTHMHTHTYTTHTHTLTHTYTRTHTQDLGRSRRPSPNSIYNFAAPSASLLGAKPQIIGLISKSEDSSCSELQ